MLVVLLIDYPPRYSQRGGAVWEGEHQRDLRAYAEALRHSDGETIRAYVRTARLEQPRFRIASLQQQTKISGKPGHPITEFLNSTVPLFAHLD
jgi:hypothetical protein